MKRIALFCVALVMVLLFAGPSEAGGIIYRRNGFTVTRGGCQGQQVSCRSFQGAGCQSQQAGCQGNQGRGFVWGVFNRTTSVVFPLFHRSNNCPNGNCPATSAPPMAPAQPKTSSTPTISKTAFVANKKD